MKSIKGKLITFIIPILLGLIISITLYFLHKTIIKEIVISLYIISIVYFIFIFIGLYFNIGVDKFKGINFKDIPGLTKKNGWFGQVASTDGSSGFEIMEFGDGPLSFLLGLLLSIFLPVILAVVIFVVSGSIEILIFVIAIISYYIFYNAIRFQLTTRKKIKYNFIKSMLYSLFYSLVTIGFIPIIMTIILVVLNKW